MTGYRCPRCGEEVDNGTKPAGSLEDRALLWVLGVGGLLLASLALGAILFIRHSLGTREFGPSSEQVAGIQARIAAEFGPGPTMEGVSTLIESQGNALSAAARFLHGLLDLFLVVAGHLAISGHYLTYLASRWPSPGVRALASKEGAP